MARINIGLVGVGQIARDQHIPVIAGSPVFKLAAVASHNGGVDGVDTYETIEDMLTDHPEIEAVTIATPTINHYRTAKAALQAGKHVLLEKPPTATNGEFDRLIAKALRTKRSLFQTWHLRYAPRAADAKKWLKNKAVIGGHIEWKENVQDCHPGQTWIWQPGGFGVLDPGINAISLLTQILPEPVFVEAAELFTPSNRGCPNAADVVFRTDSGVRIDASMDFAFDGLPTRNIGIDTENGRIDLTETATKLSVDGRELDLPPNPDGHHAEYAALYRRFAELIAKAESDIDATPLRLVSDIFLMAKHTTVAPALD